LPRSNCDARRIKQLQQDVEHARMRLLRFIEQERSFRRTFAHTFTTPNGANVTRRETPYLPVAAVQKTTDNFLHQVEAMLADSRLLEALKRTLSLFGNGKLVTLLLDAIGSEEL